MTSKRTLRLVEPDPHHAERVRQTTTSRNAVPTWQAAGLGSVLAGVDVTDGLPVDTAPIPAHVTGQPVHVTK